MNAVSDNAAMGAKTLIQNVPLVLRPVLAFIH
jgi:hypothetical protein